MIFDALYNRQIDRHCDTLSSYRFQKYYVNVVNTLFILLLVLQISFIICDCSYLPLIGCILNQFMIAIFLILKNPTLLFLLNLLHFSQQ